MKISFVNPPAYRGIEYIREGRCMQSTSSWATAWPPITLGTLAAIAREKAPVQLIDATIEKSPPENVIARVRAFSPDLVVVNTGFPSIDGDNQFCKALKKIDVGVLGFGLLFTLLKEESLKYCDGIDMAIDGEPEGTFREFVERRSRGEPTDNVAGLIRRDGSAVVVNPARGLIEELDSLPYPARDLFHNKHYVLPTTGRPFTLINTSRGCPFSCIYCIAPLYYGKRFRKHSLHYILGEITQCHEEFGIESFLLWEEAFTADREFCMGFCEAILDKGLRISWAATTRVNALDLEMLKLMKRSGCILLGLGIESADETILKNARKHITLDQIRNAVSLCKAARIPTMGHFIFGLPGETVASAEKTIRFATTLGLDYMQCYCAVPYPGTALGDMAVERGWLRSRIWSDYDFGGRSILDVQSISPEQVNAIREKAFRKFYFRPSYVARQAVRIGSFRRFANALKFLRWMRS